MKQISQTIPYKGMIKSIGKRMEVSGAYPMSYQGIYVDVTDLLDFRKKINQERNVKLTVNDYIVKAASISLQRVPIMNSSFNEDMTQIQMYQVMQHKRDDGIQEGTGSSCPQRDSGQDYFPAVGGDESSDRQS